MVYNHTARYYRSKLSVYHVSSKKTKWPPRNPKLSLYSKNPELNDLLKRIFQLNTFEEDAYLSQQPIVNFLVFEYSSYDGKLTLSLSIKGEMINVIEVLEEKEIIRTLKILYKKKIPCWVANLFKRFKLHFPCNVCLSNISVTDGENTTSVFRLLLKPQTTKKKAIIDLDSEANEVRSQVESPVGSVIQVCNYSDNSLLVWPNEQSQIFSFQEMRVDMFPQDVLETDLRMFLKTRQVTNEAFLIHHNQKGKVVSCIYSVFAEHGKSVLYLMKEVSYLETNLMFLKNVEKSEISHLKIMEFQEDNRQHLNDYIFLLLNKMLSSSTYFKLKYISLSSEEIRTIDVMELNIVFIDGKQYEYLYGNKYEIPFDREYFRFKEIARIGNMSLTWNSICTLSPQMWLNDIIIDAYLNLIAERSKINSALPSVYVFNTYFLHRLKMNRVQLQRFSAAQDVLQSDILFIPCNVNSIHWALYCVDNRNRTILYYDSFKSMTPNYLGLIADFLMKIAERHPHLVRGPCPLRYFVNIAKAKKQKNSYDCGVFVLIHAEYLSRNQPFNFSENDMPRFREQVMQELFNQKLSNEMYRSTPSQTPCVLYPMCKIGDTSLTLNSLHSLSMPSWLDEMVVNSYLNLIAVRSKQYPDILPSVFVFDTNFSRALVCGNIQLGKYTASDILQFDLLFIPLSFYPKHWVLFCVNKRRKTIQFYDSCRSNICACLNVMNLIEQFLSEVAAVLRLEPVSYRKKEAEAVKQIKSEGCGIFLLCHAEYLSREEKFNFAENEMLQIRSQISYELCVQKLSSPLPDIRPPGFADIPSDLEIGCTNDKFQTLVFNIPVGDIVLNSYMDFLKKNSSVWVYPDGPDESKNILLFPFKNKRGWALIAIDRSAKVLRYFNIHTTGEIVEELRLTKLFYQDLQISDFTHVKLPFSEHFIDSGVYVIATSYCMAKGIPISFDDHHIAYLRKKIYWDLKSESVEDSGVSSEINQGSNRFHV